MTQPSDLVTHYSSKIFQTRLYALTLIGTVLGTSTGWIKGTEESNFMGLLLILMVASLGESNFRYTHSYLSACRASSRRNSGPDAGFWHRFLHMNEDPWSKEDWQSHLHKFLLYWSTYIPGLAGGWYLIWRGEGPIAIGWVGLVSSACALGWWIYVTFRKEEHNGARKKIGTAHNGNKSGDGIVTGTT